jgi:hypothetical protein
MNTFFDHRFPGRWIGRGGPQYWPPRSPDSNPAPTFLFMGAHDTSDELVKSGDTRCIARCILDAATHVKIITIVIH